MNRIAAAVITLLTGIGSPFLQAAETDKAEAIIQYLGVGGWLIRWHGEGLLIAPSFSNPSLMNIEKLPPVWVKADRARIDDQMPEAHDVTMLLVGHGHYDHLLDVPRVMEKQAPNATLYGSTTVKNILHAFSDRQKMAAEGEPWVDSRRVVDATPYMEKRPGCEGSQAVQSGRWLTSTGGHFRAMPIQSMHASHIFGYTVAHGESPVLNDIPTTVFGWKQGQSMAWVIDFLSEDKQPVFRIHFQDSPATPPCGLPPVFNDHINVSTEILGVAGWDKVENYPNKLLDLTKPQLILLGHWENIFGNDPKKTARPMPHQDVEGMRRITQQLGNDQNPPARVQMPSPFDKIALSVPPQK